MLKNLPYFLKNENNPLCFFSGTYLIDLAKNKVHNHEKQRKLAHMFLNSKNMANFEAFRLFISSSINISFFGESVF